MQRPALLGARFAAVLFDLDGTLVDSTASVQRSWERWAAERGLAPGAVVVQHGMPARQVMAGLVTPDQLPAAVARIERIEVEDVGDVAAIPGALEALAAMPPGRWAIVTSGTTPLALGRIRSAGLPMPPVLVTANDVITGKPDPTPYLLAAERLGVDPGDCLAVEDAPAGLASASAAGCATLALISTYPAHRLAADLVVPDLTAVRFAADGDLITLISAGLSGPR